jgi:hypothetical protein
MCGRPVFWILFISMFSYLLQASCICGILMEFASSFCVTLPKNRQYTRIALSVLQFVRLSWKPNIGYDCHFLTFLHQTSKWYCLWQQGYGDAKIFRSRSHLTELCPFLYRHFLFWSTQRRTQVFNWTPIWSISKKSSAWK